MNALNKPGLSTDEETTRAIAFLKVDGLLDEIHGLGDSIDVAEEAQATARRIAADESERMASGGMEMVFHAPLNF